MSLSNQSGNLWIHPLIIFNNRPYVTWLVENVSYNNQGSRILRYWTQIQATIFLISFKQMTGEYVKIWQYMIIPVVSHHTLRKLMR